MNKSVSHYLRDYLKLTNSKFSLMGGADRALTSTEASAAEATLLKYVKPKNPPPGPNDVFIYEIKSAADFAAAPVESSTGGPFLDYNAFVQDFKDVQKALVTKFLADADAAETAGAAGAAGTPGAAKAKTPFMGGSRSKQYGGVTTEGLKELKKAAASAGILAGVAGGVAEAVNFIISFIDDTSKMDVPNPVLFNSTMKNVLNPNNYNEFEEALQVAYRALANANKANNATDVANDVFANKTLAGIDYVRELDDLPNTIFELRLLV